jgi:hypothetical protein
MTTDNKQNLIIQQGIVANLAALTHHLTEAADLAKQGTEAIVSGEQNLAIGTIVDLNRLLSEAQALYTAAVALHRGRL